MFTGLSAFPLTPITDDAIDEKAFATLVQRLAAAGVDSIGALGSTGSYAYLTREERARAARIAVQHADGTPVIVGIGALRTRHVLEAAEDAQNAGAAGVVLAPMSYQRLTDDDAFGLYEDVSAHLSVPLVVYDNPAPPTSPSATSCTRGWPRCPAWRPSRSPASRPTPPPPRPVSTTYGSSCPTRSPWASAATPSR
ncbi:dihydrodipicolinate synthase family protein [Streptomyces sp. RTd22]|uniref:dihydrodipicolinate synthase family protein n=1 Tax=Streptomyces sp. RTd22 TaxID=1841249 RepID=UPI000B2D9B65|nr:dihydrodipicolinate synthase family protein [Streptomyces sp. RTd22]